MFAFGSSIPTHTQKKDHRTWGVFCKASMGLV